MGTKIKYSKNKAAVSHPKHCTHLKKKILVSAATSALLKSFAGFVVWEMKVSSGVNGKVWVRLAGCKTPTDNLIMI